MCLSRTQTILILSLLVTGTDNNPMRLPNSVLEGHFMISSDNRGQGAGGGGGGGCFLNSPGCHRAQKSILDYTIKRGDL